MLLFTYPSNPSAAFSSIGKFFFERSTSQSALIPLLCLSIGYAFKVPCRVFSIAGWTIGKAADPHSPEETLLALRAGLVMDLTTTALLLPDFPA